MKATGIFFALLGSLVLFANCADEYNLDRSIVIKAPVAVVFENVNNLKKNEAWSPWMAADPTMKTTYNEIAAGQGASSSWTSEDSGEGTQVIVEVVENKKIVTDLDFKGQGKAKAFWTFEETGEGVKVTWAFQSKPTGFGDHIFGAFFLESVLGKSYEEGLSKLKEVSESQG